MGEEEKDDKDETGTPGSVNEPSCSQVSMPFYDFEYLG